MGTNGISCEMNIKAKMSLQCEGLTGKGIRCKRLVSTQNVEKNLQYCFSHSEKGIKKEGDSVLKLTKSEVHLSRKIGGDTCAICLDDVVLTEDADLECGHWFHLKCISKVRKAKCPCCMRDLTTKSRLTIGNIKAIEKRTKIDIAQRRVELEEATRRLIARLQNEQYTILSDNNLNRLLASLLGTGLPVRVSRNEEGGLVMHRDVAESGNLGNH